MEIPAEQYTNIENCSRTNIETEYDKMMHMMTPCTN